MAKRSSVPKHNPDDSVEIVIEPTDEPVFYSSAAIDKPKPAIDFDTVSNYNKVTVRSKVDGKYSCTCASGRHYVWPCIGSIVEVNEEDINELVSKHSGGKACCGHLAEIGNMFEKVGGN